MGGERMADITIARFCFWPSAPLELVAALTGQGRAAGVRDGAGGRPNPPGVGRPFGVDAPNPGRRRLRPYACPGSQSPGVIPDRLGLYMGLSGRLICQARHPRGKASSSLSSIQTTKSMVSKVYRMTFTMLHSRGVNQLKQMSRFRSSRSCNRG